MYSVIESYPNENLTEYAESDLVSHSEMSILSEVTQDETLISDMDLLRKSIEDVINNNPTAAEIKINNVENEDGNWDYFYQVYDADGKELMKSSEMLSVSAYRNVLYKETINEMIRESFQGISISDE